MDAPPAVALPVTAAPGVGAPATVQVIDVRYCGPDPSGRARTLVALTSGAPPAAGGQAAAALRAPDDCSAPLESLAQRVLPLAAGANPPVVAVAELAAGANPSELALSVERAVSWCARWWALRS